MEPLVKAYLQRHTLHQLKEEHGVNAKPNSTFDKCSLNYEQYGIKSGDVLAEQCRGLIIRPHEQLHRTDETGDWMHQRVGDVDILAWPMDRFYNHGDPAAAAIDWNAEDLRVYEKLDGTMIILYWDPLHQRWNAGTRSVPEADIPIFRGHLEIGDMTFSQLFHKALLATREHLEGKPLSWKRCSKCNVQFSEVADPDLPCSITGDEAHAWRVDDAGKIVHFNKEHTYVFELTSPWNQVVVKYAEPRTYLLACRHTATGKEVPIETIRLQHVLRPATWGIKDAVSLAVFVDSADPAKLEGAVVCNVAANGEFKRLKVKNKSWIMSSKAKDTVTASPRSALECVILGKVDDIVPLVPDDVAGKLIKMQVAFGKYCRSVDNDASRWRKEAAGSRKRFAAFVNEQPGWKAPYFNLFDNPSWTTADWMRTTCEKGKLSSTSLDTIIDNLPY